MFIIASARNVDIANVVMVRMLRAVLLWALCRWRVVNCGVRVRVASMVVFCCLSVWLVRIRVLCSLISWLYYRVMCALRAIIISAALATDVAAARTRTILRLAVRLRVLAGLLVNRMVGVRITVWVMVMCRVRLLDTLFGCCDLVLVMFSCLS